MQNFRDVQTWQKAHALALLTYRITTDFPRDELFGLRTSLRETSVDVAAYIAEGCGKPNDAEFSRVLLVALALANRLEYYALLARDLALINEAEYDVYDRSIIEVKKMINGFNQRLQTNKVTSHS